MKTLFKICSIVIITMMCYASPDKVQAQASVSFQVFYDGLGPYGQWVNSPDYGYVWVPNAGAGFVPYATAGHWVYTNDGWTWVSDYSWGWAPFHYGRWVYDDVYGWEWIPGEEWAPAWVSWRMCDGFYGWAPLGPTGLFFTYTIPVEHWVFVRDRYFTDPYVYRHYEPRTQNATYMRSSSVIAASRPAGKATYYTGPDRARVESVTGHSVAVYNINARSSPGQSVGRNEVNIYRPAVLANAGNRKPAPAHVVEYNSKRVQNRPASQSPARRASQSSGHSSSINATHTKVSPAQRSYTRHVAPPEQSRVHAQPLNRQQSRPRPQFRAGQPSSPHMAAPRPSAQPHGRMK